MYLLEHRETLVERCLSVCSNSATDDPVAGAGATTRSLRRCVTCYGPPPPVHLLPNDVDAAVRERDRLSAVARSLACCERCAQVLHFGHDTVPQTGASMCGQSVLDRWGAGEPTGGTAVRGHVNWCFRQWR